jgi:predicted GNAT superfamily acetyltransferase
VEYLIDFYGEMSDAINAGQGSDRLLLQWDVDSDLSARCATRDGPEPPLRPDRKSLPDNEIRLVQVPPDIERMRAADPAAAREWRHRVRAELGELMATGWTVVSVSRDGYYELRSNA